MKPSGDKFVDSNIVFLYECFHRIKLQGALTTVLKAKYLL